MSKIETDIDGLEATEGTASYPPIKFPKKFSNNGAIEKFILKIAKTNANDPALGRAVELALNTFPLSSNKILWEDNLEALPEKTRAIVEQSAEISDNGKAINSVDFQMRYGMSRAEAEKVYPFGRAKKPSDSKSSLKPKCKLVEDGNVFIRRTDMADYRPNAQEKEMVMDRLRKLTAESERVAERMLKVTAECPKPKVIWTEKGASSRKSVV